MRNGGAMTDDDEDGIPSLIDNCPLEKNPQQGSCTPNLGSAGDGNGPDAGPSGDIGAPNGTTCEDADACATGHCADGVCCDAPCVGTCRSCNLPG